ncbi:uncharacterized protein LOC130693528 [Daphnia carinata]|uniref:uncharacterized protein LOC130693528 n=1 Tax=Daphnia carinata TaxID=120202 RepID=UPI00257B396A|nr:uncharacterized protein LOC130693528 [Daphnia carinata]
MDSRQFGVLLLVVFLAILAPIENAEGSISSNPVSSTTENPTNNSTAPANTTTTQNSGTTISSAPSSSIGSPDFTHPEMTTTPAVSTQLSTSASIPPPVQPVTAIPAIATTNSVTNDHGIRDVSSDMEKCSTSFETILEKEKENWILERAFLAVSDEGSTITLEQFCKQLQTIMRLDTICNNGKNATDAEDVKVAPIVAGLASMFTSVCSDPKTRLNVTVGDSTSCVEFIRVTAKSCSANPLTKAVHVYPTQVIFEEMTRDNCTVVSNTKDCIIKALEHGDKCSSAQQTIIIDAITKMTKGLPCVLPHSANAATSAPAITGSDVTTPKTPGNAGTNFQVNFFTILPVLLLAFKFY